MTETSKAAWRSRLRAGRRSMDDAVRTSAAAGLAAAGLQWAAAMSGPGRAGTFCAYVSTGSEPPTGLLLAALDDAGHRVFVPTCEPGRQLAWVAWRPGVAMARSRLAPVMEPVGDRRTFAGLGRVDGVLLPALAADTTGVRLGQGGGYYDRFLASLDAPPPGGPATTGLAAAPVPAAPTAAVVHEHEAMAPGALPHDVLDKPVGWLLTPAGYRQCPDGTWQKTRL